GVQIKPAIGDRAHEIDAPARTIRLLASLDIGGTGGGAQPAVHAVEKQFVINAGALGLGGGQYRQRVMRGFDGGAHFHSYHSGMLRIARSQIPSTKRPGLKMPLGSSFPLTALMSQ